MSKSKGALPVLESICRSQESGFLVYYVKYSTKGEGAGACPQSGGLARP